MKKTETETESNKKTESNENPGPEPLVTIEPATVTPEQLEDLKARAARADEHWDRLLRTTADLDNFRKRAAREKQEAIKYANESLIAELLPILDQFELALNAAKATPSGSASLQEGIALVQQQLKKTLANAGLDEVDASGHTFDPNWHEAISQVETADAPEGQVVQQLRKGYKLRDKLLRPASVIVAKKPAGA